MLNGHSERDPVPGICLLSVLPCGCFISVRVRVREALCDMRITMICGFHIFQTTYTNIGPGPGPTKEYVWGYGLAIFARHSSVVYVFKSNSAVWQIASKIVDLGFYSTIHVHHVPNYLLCYAIQPSMNFVAALFFCYDAKWAAKNFLEM